MKIRIFQINQYRDTQRVMFQPLQEMKRITGKETVDSRIYDTVYEKDVACETLDDVLRMVNIQRPDDYYGRSLSMSDVVEVISGGAPDSGFYYCDMIGFSKVEFQPELARSRTIRVVLLEPGKPARLADIDRSLGGLQKTVGGYIEVLYPFKDTACMVCNEEGKLQNFPLNRGLYMDGQLVDIIAGTCFICDGGGEDLGGLTEAQQKKYLAMYLLPELYIT